MVTPEEGAWIEQLYEGRVWTYYGSRESTEGSLRMEIHDLGLKEFVDEQGDISQGYGALLGLWIDSDPNPSARTTQWVHVGQAIALKQYRVTILEISSDDTGSHFVTVACTEVD